jgi:hypothetical protein
MGSVMPTRPAVTRQSEPSSRRRCRCLPRRSPNGSSAAGATGSCPLYAPDALAAIAAATLNTLAVRARTGAEPAALDALIDATIDVICGQSG